MNLYGVVAKKKNQLDRGAYISAATLVPLKALKPSYLEDVFRHVVAQTAFPGQVIFDTGTYDQQHIFIQHGKLLLEYPSGYREIVDACTTQLAVAHEQPRPCRAVAATDCTLLRIDSDHLDRTLSWSQIAEYLLSEIALERDLDEDVDWMQTVLNSNLFFKVPPVNVEQIFSRLTPMVVDEGEVIIRQGEIGDCCYFLKEGEAEVHVCDEDSPNCYKVADIGVGRCFGEDALVNETVRNATVKMSSDGVLMRLEKSDFSLLLSPPAVEQVTESEASALNDSPIYVDVRSEDEYSLGHIAFSANVPLNLMSLKKRLLSPEKLYICYCDTGRRSLAAAFLLGKQGYNVLALKGGYIGAGLSAQLVAEEGHILREGELASVG